MKRNKAKDVVGIQKYIKYKIGLQERIQEYIKYKK